MLDQVCHIHGHLVNLCAVVLLNVTQDANVVTAYKIDGHTLRGETLQAVEDDVGAK